MNHEHSDVLAGHIQLYDAEIGQQLVGICQTCKFRLNKKYRPRKCSNPEAYAQGRPMGTLIAWLHLACPGDPQEHFLMSKDLDYSSRAHARDWGASQSHLEPAFGRERGKWDHEETAEPKDLP